MREKAPFAAAALLALTLAALPAACAAPHGATAGPVTTPGSRPHPDVRYALARPPVAILVRDGDPRGGLAVAVSTAGIDPAAGAEVAVALAALTLARLQAKGLREVAVTPGWDEYRVRLLVTDAADAAALVDAVSAAMLTPAAPDAPELALVQQRLLALAHRPMADAALYDAVRCAGEPFSMPQGTSAPAVPSTTIESWRLRAHDQGRVALAAVGGASVTEAVARAVAAGPTWPAYAVTPERAMGDPQEGGEVVYDAADLAPGMARATLAIHTATPEQAVAAADELGDPRGALVTRLGALESPARLFDVTASAHPSEGCLAVTLLFAARDLGNDAPARIATAVALARQEVLAELADAKDTNGTNDRRTEASLGRTLAGRAGDPRDAAETAAWWTLLSPRALGSHVPDGDRRGAQRTHATLAQPRVTIAVGLGTRRGLYPDAQPSSAIRTELDRATVAWHEPVVEARTRVESGQGELWLLLASPCGTLEEDASDAGLGAVVALATAERAGALGGGARSSGVTAEGWATADGLGVIAHAPPMPGESSIAHARRVADAAARSFAADSLDTDAIAHARGTLLALANGEASRAFSGLALALAPAHPSWISPLGTADALGRSSDAAVSMRASALRAGPLRVAVLANTDPGQSEAAVRAVDRWVARRPGEVRACPAVVAASPARPGTYPVEIAGATSSEAWLALPVPPADAAARASASLLAAALDGEDGLLAQVLGAGFARAWSARVVGPSRAPVLVIRVSSVQGALDAAVAQTRALLDRLRVGGMTETDLARAEKELTSASQAASLDPKNRLLALWHGDAPADASSAAQSPSLEALRAFASATLRDESLVIVAARPTRDLTPASGAEAPSGPAPTNQHGPHPGPRKAP